MEDDGGLSIPVDAILEAAWSLESHRLNGAVQDLKSGWMVSALESAKALVERVGEVQKAKLWRRVEFQSEPDQAIAHQRWKAIERTIFGVDYRDQNRWRAQSPPQAEGLPRDLPHKR